MIRNYTNACRSAGEIFKQCKMQSQLLVLGKLHLQLFKCNNQKKKRPVCQDPNRLYQPNLPAPWRVDPEKFRPMIQVTHGVSSWRKNPLLVLSNRYIAAPFVKAHNTTTVRSAWCSLPSGSRMHQRRN